MNLHKINTRLVACFTLKELIDLLLFPMELFLLKESLDARSIGKRVDTLFLKKFIPAFSKNTVNSKDSEYWTAIFSLYEDFGNNSEICFYLKDSFNPSKDTISSKTDLENFKRDPPDIIIRQKSGKYFEFELKQYRGELSEDKLFIFIKDKILCYAASFNYCIDLRGTLGTTISTSIFEDLYKRIKKLSLKRDFGRICIIFNANNEHMIFANIYPDFFIYKQPFKNGSDQIKSLLDKEQ
ncbi:hypothetical protein KKI22_00760 [Patescibacteria group bacterium]|nr:hypothetical protein [Patescibacteria group bacterium]